MNDNISDPLKPARPTSCTSKFGPQIRSNTASSTSCTLIPVHVPAHLPPMPSNRSLPSKMTPRRLLPCEPCNRLRLVTVWWLSSRAAWLAVVVSREHEVGTRYPPKFCIALRSRESASATIEGGAHRKPYDVSHSRYIESTPVLGTKAGRVNEI